jgi:hypothetical protein
LYQSENLSHAAFINTRMAMRALLMLPALVGALQKPAREVSLHEQQMEFATSAVSTDCTVTVDAKARTMFLESNLGKFTVKDGKITDEQGTVMDSPPKALICLGNKEAPSDGPALMVAASGAGYLMKATGQGNPFDFFLNKHCWAKNNNMQYYLWLGNPQDTSGFMNQKDPDALPCKDGAPGNHYFVIAGMRQLLQEKPNSWIVSMDLSDTFFTKTYAHTNLFTKYLDDRFDFIGGATAGGTEVFINGAIVAYKKSEWAKNFAAEWFKNRCGGMNQLAMWASLFKLWHQDVPTWEYSTGKMATYYGGAREYARAHAGGLLTDPEEIAAHKQWTSSGKLPHSLSFPHVMVHANMGIGGVDGTAYRADMDRTKEPFVCHNTMDRHRFVSCNAQASMCVLPEQCEC